MNYPDASAKPDSDDVHSGYTPEDGLLSRLREWTDLFGWLRLVRVLRIAGSPITLGIVATTLAIWGLGQSVMTGPDIPKVSVRTDPSVIAERAKPLVAKYLANMPSSLIGRENQTVSFGDALLSVLWTLFIWTPVVLFLMRQGALLVAGRNLGDARSTMRLALQRAPRAWLIAWMPFACAIAIGLSVMLLGFVSRGAMGVQWLEVIVAVVIAVVSLVAGILLFGANFAVPLGYAALINEAQPDSLDSLSRGFEYVYRRPVQLTVYVVLAMVPLWIVTWLSTGIADSATQLCGWILPVLGSPEHVIESTIGILRQFSTVVAITVVGGMIGGVYLLIRSDAGGQEVEDLWVPAADPGPPLPELPRQDDQP